MHYPQRNTVQGRPIRGAVLLALRNSLLLFEFYNNPYSAENLPPIVDVTCDKF